MSECSQRTYLLRLLRSQGLSPIGIKIVFQAIIVAKIMYALPAWGGFLSADLIGVINSFFKRMVRYGFTDNTVVFDCLLTSTDLKIFSKMQQSNHCLFPLLPEQRPVLSLRPRGHSFQLPSNCSSLHKRSFVARCLFNFI
jgi:hypothetical protein